MISNHKLGMNKKSVVKNNWKVLPFSEIADVKIENSVNQNPTIETLTKIAKALNVDVSDLMGIIGSEKPWEVVVGQVIADLTWDDSTNFREEGKMLSYLGERVVKNIIPKTDF